MESKLEPSRLYRESSTHSDTSSLMEALRALVDNTDTTKELEIPCLSRHPSNCSVSSSTLGLLVQIADADVDAAMKPGARALGFNSEGGGISLPNSTTKLDEASQVTRGLFFTRREKAKERTAKRKVGDPSVELQEISGNDIRAQRRISNRESARRHRHKAKEVLQSALTEVGALRLENAALKEQVAILLNNNQELTNQLAAVDSSSSTTMFKSR